MALTQGLVKQYIHCECDTLVMLANSHIELRQYLGHPDIRDRALQSRRTVIDNVKKLSPRILDAINVEAARYGQKLPGKTPATLVKSRRDSFVVVSNVRWSTDISLLWDAVRKGQPGDERDGEGALARMAKKTKRIRRPSMPRSISCGKSGTRAKMTRSASRNLQAVRRLDGEGGGRACLTRTRSQAEQDPDARAFVHCTRILLDQICRRAVEGETIPHHEKFFSVFK